MKGSYQMTACMQRFKMCKTQLSIFKYIYMYSNSVKKNKTTHTIETNRTWANGYLQGGRV